MSEKAVTIFWFRRDLRLDDNAGLYHALRKEGNVLPLFIFDTDILNSLADREDRRVVFIFRALEKLRARLEANGSSLLIRYGKPLQVWEEITAGRNIKAVYANHDYEPSAKERDKSVGRLLAAKGVAFHTFKDQCIFEREEVLKDNGTPYTVFTPYKNKWRSLLTDFYACAYPVEKYLSGLCRVRPEPVFRLEQTGFRDSDFRFPPPEINDRQLREYAAKRDIPSAGGTSRLNIHLRFGTLSIREALRKALPLSDTWVNELIWRDFYMMILDQFPHVVGHAFKREYDNIRWRNHEEEFGRWCRGETGYPLVDAGMRELNATGFMHNRVRMVTASFLSKHLLVDWRWGEAYFAAKLNDYELSSNNGGWQWAAGTGCDAAPYFRIFNPYEQARKFDPEMKYIRKWVPEANSSKYPAPVVEHAYARARCLETYKAGLQK